MQIPHSASKSYLFSNPPCLKGNKHHGHLRQVQLSNMSVFGLTVHQRHSLCQRSDALKRSLKVSLHLAPFPSPGFQDQAVTKPLADGRQHTSLLCLHGSLGACLLSQMVTKSHHSLFWLSQASKYFFFLSASLLEWEGLNGWLLLMVSLYLMLLVSSAFTSGDGFKHPHPHHDFLLYWSPTSALL